MIALLEVLIVLAVAALALWPFLRWVDRGEGPSTEYRGDRRRHHRIEGPRLLSNVEPDDLNPIDPRLEREP